MSLSTWLNCQVLHPLKKNTCLSPPQKPSIVCSSSDCDRASGAPLPDPTLECWWACSGRLGVYECSCSRRSRRQLSSGLPHPLAFNSLPTLFQDGTWALAGRGCICLICGWTHNLVPLTLIAKTFIFQLSSSPLRLFSPLTRLISSLSFLWPEHKNAGTNVFREAQPVASILCLSGLDSCLKSFPALTTWWAGLS